MGGLSQFQFRIVLLFILAIPASSAASGTKIHVITFGKWTTTQWFPEGRTSDAAPLPLKIRPLLVDARIKEFTLGPAHDVTDRLFVVQRAFRVNDSLPQESSQPRWQWQRGGWLLVDRATGHISPVNLPEFDALHSAVSWYRDYAAYCGVSDDGKRIYAIVAQLTRRKPVLKKPLSTASPGESATPDSACPAPAWQRTPVRVSFEDGQAKQTFAIRGHVVDLLNDNDGEDEEEASK